jgi:hypothetical protein
MQRCSGLIVGCLVLMVLSLAPSSSLAQVYNRSRGSFSTVSQNRLDARYSARSNILGRPTVSPYLGLTNIGTSGAVDSTYNYFTSVRPRLQQMEESRQQQRSIAALQQQMTSIQTATSGRDRQGMRVTGHPTRFHNYSHYYPAFGR